MASDDEVKIGIDRTPLFALAREITATHLFVWTMQPSGSLQSMKIPLASVGQKVSDAARIMDQNLDQAMIMLNAASAAFDAAVQSWEGKARQSEQDLKRSAKPGKLSQVVAKHNQVRPRLAPVKSVFRRAVSTLQNAQIETRRREGVVTDDSPDEKL